MMQIGKGSLEVLLDSGEAPSAVLFDQTIAQSDHHRGNRTKDLDKPHRSRRCAVGAVKCSGTGLNWPTTRGRCCLRTKQTMRSADSLVNALPATPRGAALQLQLEDGRASSMIII